MRLFRSLYDYPFDKDLPFEQWTDCKTNSSWPWGSGRFCQPQGIIILITSPLDYFGHNDHYKILIECVWGKQFVERGVGLDILLSRKLF